jgi:hypothetical protein
MPDATLLDDPSEVSRAVVALTEFLLQTFERYRAGVQATRIACGYLLIDPTLRNVQEDPALAELLTKAKSQYHPIPRRHSALRADQQPVLIAPQWDLPATRALIEQVFRASLADLHPDSYSCGAGQRIGGWLFSDAPPNLIANHLGALMVQRMPADFPERGGKRHLLRVQDPLVLSALWEIVTPEQASVLLGPISAWYVVGTDFHLRTFTPLKTTPYLDGSIDFSVEQWQDIRALEYVHRAALLSRRLFDMEQNRRPWLAAMRRAQQLGLSDEDDLRLFAHHAVTVHPYFDCHPALLDVLSQWRTEGYGGATADLSDADWDTIAAEMKEAKLLEAITG